MWNPNTSRSAVAAAHGGASEDDEDGLRPISTQQRQPRLISPGGGTKVTSTHLPRETVGMDDCLSGWLVGGCHFAQAVTKCSRVSRRTSLLCSIIHKDSRDQAKARRKCAHRSRESPHDHFECTVRLRQEWIFGHLSGSLCVLMLFAEKRVIFIHFARVFPLHEPVPYLLNVRWCRHELLPQAHVCATRRQRAGGSACASVPAVHKGRNHRSVEAARAGNVQGSRAFFLPFPSKGRPA